MFKVFNKINLLSIFLLLIFTSILKAELIKNIEVEGNKEFHQKQLKCFGDIN